MSPSATFPPSLLILISISLFLFSPSLFPPHSPQISTPFPFVPFCPLSSTSPSTTHYDPSTLSCPSCPSNSIISYQSNEKCQCSPLFYSLTPYTDDSTFSCSSCPPSYVSTRDGTSCATCPASSTIVNNDCLCPSNSFLSDPSTGSTVKSCTPCPSNGYVLSSDPYTCLYCGSANMTIGSNGQCQCGNTISDRTVNHQYCFPISLYNTITSPIGMLYNDIKSSDSSSTSPALLFPASYMTINYYPQSSLLCSTTHDRPSCNLLSNICVMQQYNLQSDACKELLSLASSSSIITTTVNGFASSSTPYGWKGFGLPFMYWATNDVINADVIKGNVVLNNPPNVGTSRTIVGTLMFYMAKYQWNGTFIGWESLSSQLQLCGGSTQTTSSYLRMGNDYINDCTLSLLDVIHNLESNSQSNVFYQLFYLDANNNIYPVPIKVINYRDSSGNQVNGNDIYNDENDDTSTIQLVNRFFLLDTFSSLSTDPLHAYDDPTTPLYGTVIQYAQHIILRITMLNDNSQNMISPPLLIIQYGQRLYTDISSSDGGTSSSSLSFEVQYNDSFNGVITAGIVLFSISIILGVVVTIRRICVWERKNHGDKLNINLPFILKCLIYLFSSLGTFFFISITAITFYVFLFYKGQQTIYLLLPPISGYPTSLLGSMISVVFVAKLIEVVYTLYEQIGYDVFLMDWEKEKMGSNGSGGSNGNNDIENINGTTLPSISVWRRIMAANKLYELQTKRLINVPFTLMFHLFLTKALGLSLLASSQPDFTIYNITSRIHPILLYAVDTFFLLLIIYIQLWVVKYVYHRYFHNEPSSFVDLLSQLNISCIIFDEKYHCYYIHGKTVHTHSDVSMEEMTLQMISEQKSWVKQRGLLPGKDTFELYVTAEFRAHYDEEFQMALHRQLAYEKGKKGGMAPLGSHQSGVGGRRGQLGNNNGMGTGGGSMLSTVRLHQQGAGVQQHGTASSHPSIESQMAITSQLVRANESLNLFLQSFIERTLPQYPYDFGEYSLWRRIFKWPVMIPLKSPSLFFDDNSHYAFTQTTMMGMENDMALLIITLYGICEYAFQDEVVSVLVVFLVDRIIMRIRGYYGKINISRKTLIDERFLG